MTGLHEKGDGAVTKWPVSIKGVVMQSGEVLLLKNERDEWELPGGKLDPGETPEECVAREINEEVAISGTTGPILDSWVYRIKPGTTVLVITYGFNPDPFEKITKSPEHKEAKLFPIAKVPNLNMPEPYKRSILNWAER